MAETTRWLLFSTTGRPPTRSSAVLTQSGYDFELLEGKEGKAHLDPASGSGQGVTLKRLAKVFGDQHRVLDHLNQQLDDGKVVISVDAEPEEADEAAKVL